MGANINTNGYIFSDESGHWSDKPLYIRSWVFFSESDYFELIQKMALFREINNDIEKEIKFNKNHDYTIFANLNFKVYFTLTFSEDFTKRNFEAIKAIESQNEDTFTINNQNVKASAIHAIKNAIFFNIYEKFHVDNALKFFRNYYSGKNLIVSIDSPQYVKKEYTEMFKGVKPDAQISLKIIKKSKDNVGIQFADILSGNLRHILENLDGKKFTEFQMKIVKDFSLGNGIANAFKNNPQIIMWDDKYYELVEKLKKIHRETLNDFLP